MAGSLSGLTATCCTYPLDVARTRIVARIGDRRYTGLLTTLGLTLREEGAWALYRGIGPSLFGGVLYEGCRFGTYGFFKEYFAANPGVGAWLGWLQPVVAGSLAGMAAGLMVYPNDTVRRRLQLQGVDGGHRRYQNAIHCYSKMLRREGPLAFYRGAGVNVLRAAPSSAVQFCVFEGLKKLAHRSGRWARGEEEEDEDG